MESGEPKIKSKQASKRYRTLHSKTINTNYLLDLSVIITNLFYFFSFVPRCGEISDCQGKTENAFELYHALRPIQNNLLDCHVGT